MEEQNNKKPCWSVDRKDAQKLIDYFMCRLRRSVLFLMACYFIMNALFTIPILFFNFRIMRNNMMSIGNKPQNTVAAEKAADQKEEKDNKNEDTWKKSDIESISSPENSASSMDIL